ncbi:MAG UNVERIFIED_CONTAM: glycosyltransferase [Anaerolineae bacterium]
MVQSAEEAIERYRYLLAHDAERRQVGEAARRRVWRNTPSTACPPTLRNRARVPLARQSS